MLTEKIYHSVLIPYSEDPSIWHPTESTGPFAVLTRGAFDTVTQAHEWACVNIPGYDYSVKEYDNFWVDG